MSAEKLGVRFFTAKDADPTALAGQTIAVLGYGHLGQPMALNLRDSGITNLVIGNIDDDYADQAREHDFQVLSISAAVQAADIVLILLSDEVIPEVFATDIPPVLKPGSALVFASGYTLAYNLIAPPAGIDVFFYRFS